jgi:hypothetical protein
LKKNTNSPTKKEPRAKRAKAQRPVQRETKEVLAELVEKLQGKLELKSTSASQAEAGPRGELSPNLNRLTVGVDLGDQWSHFCILGFEGETLSEGQLQTRQAEVAEFFQALPPARVVYLGLVPKQEDSGESQPQLGISKAGDTMVRKLLVGSAHYILGPFGPDSDLRSYGLRLCERGGKNAKKRAAVAVARKLAVLLHRLWVSGEAYEPLGYASSRGIVQQAAA